MKPLTLIALLSSALTALPAAATLELAQKKNCMGCHGVDKKLVGPAYKEVAAKYAKDKDAYKKLAARIQNGSEKNPDGSAKLNWGPMPMPANAVTPAEAETLAKWILSLK